MRVVIFFLFIILIWLQYLFFFGKNGLFDLIRIRNNIIMYSNIYDRNKMKIRNDQLFSEIDDLNYGYEIIEEHARSELGMIKVSEVFYRIVTK